MQVLVVAEPAVTRSPVPRATRIPVAPVAPAAAGQAVPVLVVARPVVMVVPQVVVLRVLRRAVPGRAEPVQVLPQEIVPAARAARVVAVPGLAVRRAAREPQELVVQEPVAQGPPVRLPECPGMPGPSEPRRPRVAQVPQAERVVPAVMPRMALRRTAVLRPETGPWARSV